MMILIPSISCVYVAVKLIFKRKEKQVVQKCNLLSDQRVMKYVVLFEAFHTDGTDTSAQKTVDRAGLKPTTSRLPGKCSTDCAQP